MGKTRRMETFDWLVQQMNAALVVVTVDDHGTPAGCVVGFHIQCSIEPRQYAVWLSKLNHTYRVLAARDRVEGSYIGIHSLTEADHDLAELFGANTGDEVDKFAACDWHRGPHGVPILDRCPSHFVVGITAVVDLDGDHMCFAGNPVAAERGDDYRALRLSAAMDIDPGHPPEEIEG